MSLPFCPTGCNETPPKPVFSPCAGEFNEGQIRRVYLFNRDYPLTDWTDPVELLGRISNTSNNVDAIRELVVIGDKPAAESNEIEVSDKRLVRLNKTHTLNIRIDETNNDNHNFIRELECNNTYAMLFATGTKLYGSNDGIDIKSIKLDHMIPESYKELMVYTGTIVWDDTFHYEVCDNPLI